MKIVLLAGNTFRARAYSQILAENLKGLDLTICGVLFGHKKKTLNAKEPNDETIKYCSDNQLFVPDFNESVLETFHKNKWPFIGIDDIDVNGDDVVNAVQHMDGDIIVFAGYGGQILRQKHFENSAQYLHMHPGELPIERGSTTLYYSLLNKRNLSVTAFFMTEKIDEGSNVICCNYDPPFKGIDIDTGLDNILRADCFLKAINQIRNDTRTYSNDKEELEYYVIHPLLKHLAILSLKDRV